MPDQTETSKVRSGSRLCENSEVQFACRNSALVSLISEISCTDSLGQEKAIENIFLLVLGSRAFSHSLGQNRKYSLRADDVRSTPESGLKSDIAPSPVCANNGLMHRNMIGTNSITRLTGFQINFAVSYDTTTAY